MALRRSLDIIKRFEGLSLKAYPDPATKADPITIGYGNTQYEDGRPVKMGEVLTLQRAEELLDFWVTKYENAVKADFPDLNDNQLAACTSFAYNCGLAAFRKSTLWKKMKANREDPSIALEFKKWVKAGGKVFKGLVKRREVEANIYFTKI